MNAILAVLWNIAHPRRMPRCRHGFSPDQGIGLWCPGCATR